MMAFHSETPGSPPKYVSIFLSKCKLISGNMMTKDPRRTPVCNLKTQKTFPTYYQ